MHFAAVKTTGIYCRPGCGAGPNPSNVHGFALAAAAEAAGYRPCLRCRPYRVSDVTEWPDGPELVCRAVRLILDGVLDTGGEADLAARLGVSARHLRRLCAQHLGVTPDGLARSARAHFARRLLDDTDLSITQIAFAAGFGSLRQFNRVCLEVFRDTPRALRDRRRRTDRLAADGGLALRLPYEGQFDWPALVEQLRSRAVPGVEAVDDDRYRRTVVVDGDAGVIELAPGGDGELRLIAHLPHWEGLIHLVRRARRIASLDGRTPRTAGAWDEFEVAVCEIVRHHDAPLEPFVDRFGERVTGLEPIGLTHAFPSPRRLAAARRPSDGLSVAAWHAIRALAAQTEQGTEGRAA